MAHFRKPTRRRRRREHAADAAADTGCCCVEAAFNGCYVATAAHGDFDAPEVVTLRRYRDQRLRTRPAGRAFSDAYYRYGRYPAAAIHRYPVLRRPARAILRPAVWWAQRKIT